MHNKSEKYINKMYIMYVMKKKVTRLIRISEAAPGEMRTIIPIEVVKELGLQKGDYIIWYIEVDEQTGEKYAAFKKAKLD
jgi:hypothetical protein